MTIEEYFGTLQQSFVEVWKEHLASSKYSEHKALNEYYDEIVDTIDSLIEGWQGAYGKTGELKSTFGAEVGNPIEYLEKLKEFTKSGRKELISEDDTNLWSTIDEILDLIDSTLYQLKELKESRKSYFRSLSEFLRESIER